MKSTLRFALMIGLLAGIALPTSAHAETWTIDAAHTHVGFKIRHMMVSWVRGSFGSVEGTLEMDGKNTETLKAKVSIDTASIDTANGKRD